MLVGLFSCFDSRNFFRIWRFFSFWSFYGFPWNTLYTSSTEAQNSVPSSSKLRDIRPNLFLCHLRAALLRHCRDVYQRRSDGLSRGRQPSLLKSLMALFIKFLVLFLQAPCWHICHIALRVPVYDSGFYIVQIVSLSSRK